MSCNKKLGNFFIQPALSLDDPTYFDIDKNCAMAEAIANDCAIVLNKIREEKKAVEIYSNCRCKNGSV